MRASSVVVECQNLLGIRGLLWIREYISGSPYFWYRSMRTSSLSPANSASSAPRFPPDESRWCFTSLLKPLWAPPVSLMTIHAGVASPRLDPTSYDRAFSGLWFSHAKWSSPFRDSESVPSLRRPSSGVLWLFLVQHLSLMGLQSSVQRLSYLLRTGWCSN